MSTGNWDLTDAVRELRDFVRKRNWEQFHSAKNLAMLLGSEVGELLGELRWTSSEVADAYAKGSDKLERISDELADVAIGILLLADRLEIDLQSAVRRKIEKNAAAYPISDSRDVAERR